MQSLELWIENQDYELLFVLQAWFSNYDHVQPDNVSSLVMNRVLTWLWGQFVAGGVPKVRRGHVKLQQTTAVAVQDMRGNPGGKDDYWIIDVQRPVMQHGFLEAKVKETKRLTHYRNCLASRLCPVPLWWSHHTPLVTYYTPSNFLSTYCVSVQAVDLYSRTVSTVALKNPVFRLPGNSYFQIASSLWSADRAFPILVFTFLEQQSIHYPR